MAPLHRVYFLGTVLQTPEVWSAPNGMAMARCGLAVPARLRQGETRHDDVCCIEVMAFGHQADTVKTAFCTGRTVLIEGRVQRWRAEQAGSFRSTPAVIAERIQCLPCPPEAPPVATDVGPALSGECLEEVPSVAEALPV
jgi:single-stranded DNA-binding protein